MVQIINIDPVHERILPFLYPNYSIEETLQKFDKFIVHRDVTSPSDKMRIEGNYDDCIIISNKIYNEYWDADVLKQKALDFARINFRSRKRSLNDLSTEDPQLFIDNLISFMFTGEFDFVEEETIVELFNVYGSQKFNDMFMQKLQQYPAQKVIASMMTFITKVLNPGNSVFYKRKCSVLSEKIKYNFKSAFTYLKYHEDLNNLHYLYFFQKLVS